MLDIEKLCRVFMPVQHPLPHADHLRGKLRTVPRALKNPFPFSLKLFTDRGVTCAEPGPGQGLELPGPCSLAVLIPLVLLPGVKRGHHEPIGTVRTKPEVNLEKTPG